jgi:hypothetical protein
MPGPKPTKRVRDEDLESIESRSTDGSDNGSDLEGFVVDEEDDSPAVQDIDEEQETLKEAERIAQNLSVAQVGRYSLRDRTKIRKVETYFDAENAAIIAKEQDKREMIQLLKKWKKSGEYVTTKEFGKKSTYEEVVEEYLKAKEALGLPDSDVESEEEEEDEESSFEDDAEAEEDESEDDEDESEDEDSEDDAEEDAEEEAEDDDAEEEEEENDSDSEEEGEENKPEVS